MRGVRRWFEGPNSGDWILVVDNADNDTDFAGNNAPIARFIPQGPRGTVLFTTRSHQVALRQGCEMIEVGKMGEEEALELFSKRFDRWHNLGDEDKKVVPAILGTMDHLPLAVVGSAAFMAETEMPPSTYWRIFQQGEERTKKLLSQPFCDIQRETDMTESILGTHFVTFDRIADRMPLAAYLLRLILFFDRENIPEELLSHSGLEGTEDLFEFHLAMGKLLGFSLITIVKRDDRTFYELHRLVQLSLQVYLPTEELNKWRATALGVVSRLFPRTTDGEPYGEPTYIQHARAVTRGSTNPIAEELGYRMGLYFLSSGAYDNAEIQFRQCIALRKGDGRYDWGENGYDRIRLLGRVSVFQGKADMAEKILQDLVDDMERSLSPNRILVLQTVDSLALALRGQGKYDESEAMYRRSVEEYTEVLGPNHQNTLDSASELASVLRRQGKYNESEAVNRRALEGYEKSLGPNHPNTLAAVGKLVMVLQVQGKYDESEAMNGRALEGFEKVLGPNHPNTLTAIHNLAVMLKHRGKYDESEVMCRLALEGREKILRPNHPETWRSAGNLALLLQC